MLSTTQESFYTGSGNGDGTGNGDDNGSSNGYGDGYGNGDGYGSDAGYGYGNGNGSGNGNGNGYGYDNGNGDGFVDHKQVLLELGIDKSLHSLFLPLSNESLEFVAKLLSCTDSLEYESILGLLELRKDRELK